MADRIEKQELEVGTKVTEGGKKEYVPFIPKTKEKHEEEDINIEEEYERTQQTPVGDDKVLDKQQYNTPGFQSQSKHFVSENPSMADRVPAGRNITDDLNDPKEKNNIFGKISRLILGKNNL